MSGVTYNQYVSDLLGKKIYVKERMENLQNQEAVTRGLISKASEKPAGTGVFNSFNYEGNERGQGSQNPGEGLRISEYQKTKEASVGPKVFTHKIEIEGLAKEAFKNNEEAYANALVLQMDQGVIDAGKELNAQLFRDGSGKLAQVNGVVSGSASVTVNNGVITHFRPGMYIDAINGSAVKQIDSIKVLSANPSTNVVTLASAQSCDDDCWLYREDVADNAPTDGKEIAGLPRVTDDGTDVATYEGITRTGAGYIEAFKGIEVDAGGANLSDDLMQKLYMRAKVYAGSVNFNKIVSNTSQIRAYIALTLPQVRYDANVKRDSSGGSKEMTPYLWMGKEWHIDTDCDFADVWLINTEKFKKFELYGLKWDSDPTIIRDIPGYDKSYALLKEYSNYGTWHPRKAVIRLTNLAKPTF